MSTRYRTLIGIGNNPTNDIVSYAISQGWTIPSTSTINAMNTFITSLQASGIWDKYDIFYNFRYNDSSLANFSRINWKNPGSYTLSYSGGFSYVNEGYEAGAIGTYLDTGFFPSVNGVNYQLYNANITFIQQAQSTIGFTNRAIINDISIPSGTQTIYGAIGRAIGGPYIAGALNSVNDQGFLINSIYDPGAVTIFSRAGTSSSNGKIYYNGSIASNTVNVGFDSMLSNSIVFNFTILGSSTTLPILKMAALGGFLTSTDAANLQSYYDTFYAAL